MSTASDCVAAFWESAMPPKVRSIREWATQEIIMPSGVYKGMKFRTEWQPFVDPLFDLIESWKWNRIFVTGCVQSGKSTIAFSIPILYHLFEMRETTVVGLPTGDMVSDKWAENLLPIINATRYRDLIPKRGAGSRGGKTNLQQFANGAALRWMAAGGGDKQRANFTAKIVCMTELDGMDEAGANSREADPIQQIEGRAESYGPQKRVFGECTLSIETGRTNQEVSIRGTGTNLAVPCLSCGHWWTPEREDLIGYQTARDPLEAEHEARFMCPNCKSHINEEDRRKMWKEAMWYHKGQQIVKGERIGDEPRTDTLGFRWNAFFNSFWSIGYIARGEYDRINASSKDSDGKEKRQCQYVWAVPYKPPLEESSGISPEAVALRVTSFQRFDAPYGTIATTVGIDPGGKNTGIHWVLVRWVKADGGVLYPFISAYGREFPLETTEDSLTAALVHLGQFLPAVDLAFIDSNWLPKAVDRACKALGLSRFVPVRGYSVTQHNQENRNYQAPKKRTAGTPKIGDGWHISKIHGRPKIYHIDADVWKRRVHDSMRKPMGQEMGMVMHSEQSEGYHLNGPRDSNSKPLWTGYARQLASEHEVRRWNERLGREELRWESDKDQVKENHYLDATAYAYCAGDAAGATVEDEQKPVSQAKTLAEVMGRN